MSQGQEDRIDIATAAAMIEGFFFWLMARLFFWLLMARVFFWLMPRLGG
jgi:hypothetical protein